MVISAKPSLSPEERCKANIRCWLAETGGPVSAPCFLTETHRLSLGILVPVSAPNRAFLGYSDDLLVHLRSRSRGKWTMGTKRKAHRPCVTKTACDGGREHGHVRYALQWILHQTSVAGANVYFFEIDFDGWNPNEGAAPAFAHVFAECLPHWLLGKQTNPEKVARYRGWEAA